MVRRIPKELGRKEYSKLSQEEKKTLWIKLVSENLGISPEEAERRIYRNNYNPPLEIHRIVLDDWENPLYIMESIMEPRNYNNDIYPNYLFIYPRFNANAKLLAQLSKDYEGPRGPRPIFASLINILRISFLANPKEIKYWIKHLAKEWHPEIGPLLELKLTASNPHLAPRGVEFSSADIRRGVYIPPSLNKDKETMQALGSIYAKGYVSNSLNSYLFRITGTMKDKDFYQNVVRVKIEEAFNLLQDQIYDCPKDSQFPDNNHNYLRLVYRSKALATYLLNHLNFPGSIDEKKNTGIAEKIKNNRYIKQFLKYYLACNARFNTSHNGETISLSINDVSKPTLEDIREILINIVKKHSITLLPHPRANSYALTIGTIPTLELFFSDFLNENPRLKGEVNSCLNVYGIGKRALNYLDSRFGETVFQYKRQK